MATIPKAVAQTQAVDKWLNLLQSQGKSKNTLRAYRADLMAFLQWSQTQQPGAALSEALPAYITTHRRMWAASTVGRKLTALRSFAAWMGAESGLDGYSAPTPARPIPHPLPEGIDGVTTLIEHATQPKQKALVALCGLVGLRVHEALAVQVQDFRSTPDGWELSVRGKGDKARIVPVSDKAFLGMIEAHMDALSQQDPTARLVDYSDRFARKAITDLGKRAGLSRPISSHDLRATYATAAYNKSLDLRAVQELMGHASISTTEVYTGITMKTMRAAGEVS